MIVWQLLYIACCLVALGAIFVQQRYRYRNARKLRWWLYSLLALGVAYEGIEAFKYGAPAFPAGRWILMPALSGVLYWAAMKDWQGRNPPEI